MTKWHDGNGVVAERTDTVIEGLIAWAGKEGVSTIKRKNIEDAIVSLTPVGGKDAINDYVERVVRYGPFSGKGGKWDIEWEKV